MIWHHSPADENLNAQKLSLHLGLVWFSDRMCLNVSVASEVTVLERKLRSTVSRLAVLLKSPWNNEISCFITMATNTCI